VLIIVENQSVPRDRRAWQIALALKAHRFDVIVVCPQGDEDRAPFERKDGVEIHRFPLEHATAGPAGYIREYSQAMRRIVAQVRRIAARRPIDIVHACNPPDFLLMAVWALRRRGTRLVFDHHDLVPELYLSRFKRGRDVLYRSTLLAEKIGFTFADIVLSANESYRRIAIERGGKRPGDVYVVRNGPDLARFDVVDPDETLKRGRRHLLAYIGVMGPQDGVDYAVRALAALRKKRGDWQAVFVGEGDSVAAVRALASSLRLDDHVDFLGWRRDGDLRRVLSTADVCLAPDPKSPLNELSTTLKVAEYMAMRRPTVAFDLMETRVTAGDSALYAPPNDVSSFAACIDQLLDDPARRVSLGELGRARVEQSLSWEHSERVLTAAYERLRSR
jgi:glycosyltransferase involved in cell wall biosynthesis